MRLRSDEAQLFFFLGSYGWGGEPGNDLNGTLQSEREIFNDIVQVNCMDFFTDLSNLTQQGGATCKVYESLKWASSRYDFEYVARVGDDAYFNARLFLLSSFPTTRLYLGKLRRLGPADADLDLKVRYPEVDRDFGLRSPPDYMSGMGMVFSSDVVHHIATTVIPPRIDFYEDVLVGLWLTPFQIEKKHSDLFQNRQELSIGPHPEMILVHYMRPIDWENIDDEGVLTIT
jgi:hypothetical protein